MTRRRGRSPPRVPWRDCITAGDDIDTAHNVVRVIRMTDVARATYNPIGPAFFADPYEQYACLRAENPIHVTKYGFMVLTRREHVVPAYRNAALSRNTKLWNDFPTW